MAFIITTLVLFVLALFLVLIGLFWLGLAILVIGAFTVIFCSRILVIGWIKDSFFVTIILSFITVFILALLFKVFVIEVFAIQSESMENTLINGDKVLVSKLSYGPRLPRSPFEIPWINLFYYLNEGQAANRNFSMWEYRRLSGLGEIRRHDILVFTKESNKPVTFIKRCIGIPGDRLTIHNGDIFVNGMSCSVSSLVKQHYTIWVNDMNEVEAVLKRLKKHYGNFGALDKINSCIEITLTSEERAQLRASAYVDSVTIKVNYPKRRPAFTGRKNLSWTFDSLGPLVVPAKGMKIQMTKENFFLYRKVMMQYEDVHVSEKNGAFCHNGIELHEYIFKKNYLFVVGDNRNNSQDSRLWGFIPEEAVIGKGICVLFSNDSTGFRWERLVRGL